MISTEKKIDIYLLSFLTNVYLRSVIKIVIIGSGNIAYHLCSALQNKEGVSIVQRYRRHSKNDLKFDENIEVTGQLNNLAKADLYIIAVADDVITQVSLELNIKNGLVVHTSGSRSIEDLKCQTCKGVFYPVQTFSMDKIIDFKEVPIAIEAENDNDLNLLSTLAHQLSPKVHLVNSEQRQKLHISAVFAHNFSNHMYTIAKELCDQYNIDFSILYPLIDESVSKFKILGPKAAQTGPARRHDLSIIKKHIDQLNNSKKNIYIELSNSILKYYNH